MIQKLLDLTVAKQKVEQLVLKVCFLLGQPANIRSEVSVRDHEESRPLDACISCCRINKMISSSD